MRMGLREINQDFSRAMRAVRAGHEVVITERRRPVAVLRAVPNRRTDAAILKELEAAGAILPGSRLGRMRPIRTVRIKGPSLDVTLREERDER